MRTLGPSTALFGFLTMAVPHPRFLEALLDTGYSKW
jgi:hypothetical protein